jgi:hypothetical protein
MIYRGTVSTTTRARILRRGVVGALAVTLWIGSTNARAAELGDTVWLPMVDPEKGAAETFERNTLGIIRTGDGEDAEWRIFRGKYREGVSRHDFFVTVGRPDLASREASRQAKRRTLLIGGISAAIVGVFVVGANVSKGGWDPPLWLGGALVGGGLIAYWVSDVFEGPDLNSDEADGLVRRYNERLRDHLQEPDKGTRIHVMNVLESLQLAPWIAPDSGGLAIAARF